MRDVTKAKRVPFFFLALMDRVMAAASRLRSCGPSSGACGTPTPTSSGSGAPRGRFWCTTSPGGRPSTPWLGVARSFADVGRRELIGRSAGLASLGLPNLNLNQAGPQQQGPLLSKPQTLLLGGGEASVSFPEWLAGCWGYEPVLVGVQFPLGKQFVNRETPGVTKASIVEAADIGASTRESPVRQRARWVLGSLG